MKAEFGQVSVKRNHVLVLFASVFKWTRWLAKYILPWNVDVVFIGDGEPIRNRVPLQKGHQITILDLFL